MRKVKTKCGRELYTLASLARRLNLSNTAVLAQRLPEYLLFRGPVQTGGQGRQTMNMTSLEGVEFLLSTSRRPEAREVARELGFSTLSRVAPIEAENLEIVREAFGDFPAKYQQWVEGYRVDLYFPTLKVAVECDEHGHRHCDPEQEEVRQRFIEAELGCTFVRFNPHEPGFNIGRVINQVMRSALTLSRALAPKRDSLTPVGSREAE